MYTVQGTRLDLGKSSLKSNRAFLHDLRSKKPHETQYAPLFQAEMKTRPHVALPPLNNNSTYSCTVASSSPAALGPYVTQLSPKASRVLLHFGDIKLKHRLSMGLCLFVSGPS